MSMFKDPEPAHLNGVPWYDAPVPPQGHACWTQTSGWVGFEQWERCACGAVRRNGRVWFERNQRRGESVVSLDVEPTLGLRAMQLVRRLMGRQQ